MKKSFLFGIFLFYVVCGLSTRMKVLKTGRFGRELRDSASGKTDKTLGLADIGKSIMGMIADNHVKLLSHSTSADRIDIEVQRSRSLSLNISVAPEQDNFIVKVQSNDGKENESLTVPSKSFYHFEVESFLKPKLGSGRPERRLLDDLTNYETLIQEKGMLIMNPQPEKSETVGNVFEVVEEDEHVGYAFCFEKDNGDIYLEFCTLLPDEEIDPNKENYSSLRYRMEIQEFSSANFAKVPVDEKEMFLDVRILLLVTSILQLRWITDLVSL